MLGQDLTRFSFFPRRTRMYQGELIVRRYWSSVCQTCALKSRCTTGKERRVSRWEHEHVLERAQARLDRQPDAISGLAPTSQDTMQVSLNYFGLTNKCLNNYG